MTAHGLLFGALKFGRKQIALFIEEIVIRFLFVEGEVARLAKQLREGSETISVEGHTDNLMIGESLKTQYPSNWELAGARAARVVRRLSAEGVEPTRLRAVSFGPFAPKAPNTSSEGRAANRRTEILLRPTVR